MSELMTAAIAAGAAVLGSGVTGFFALRTGRAQAEAVLGAAQKQADAAFAAAQKQADGALFAAQRQADVQLEVLREAHNQQETSAAKETRRKCYEDYLAAFDRALEIHSKRVAGDQSDESLLQLESATNDILKAHTRLAFYSSAAVMESASRMTDTTNALLAENHTDIADGVDIDRSWFITECRLDLGNLPQDRANEARRRREIWETRRHSE